MKKSSSKTNRPRKYVFTVLVILAIGGASVYTFVSLKPTNDNVESQVDQLAKPNSNNAYANIPDDDIQRAASDADILWEPENYPVVALVHIDSIEGGRTYSPIFEQYISPQTYGKMTVREVYRGNVSTGEQLSYSRLGGIVTYDEYWKSLNEQQREKILYLNNGKKPNDKEYIEVKFSDDINIEVDKDYLVYLIPQASKDGKHHEYLIDGVQFGLREAKGSGNSITVLNNETKKWENISSVVKQN